MLKNSLKFTLILTPAIAFGQSKYDMGAATIVENYRSAAITNSAAAQPSGQEKTGLVVSVDGPSTLDELRRLNAEVVSESNNVAIVSVAVKDIEAIAALPGVLSIEAGGQQYPMMCFARESGNADAVLSGTGLGQSYTGKGVVAGLMDQGIDPNHAAFYNSDLTENRVKAVYTYMSTAQVGTPNASYLTPDEIAAFNTDYSGWTHGTHVASIMAGGYNGTSDYGMSGRVYNSSPLPYYGLAGDADIVMCGGYLYNDNILDGVSKVVDYATSVNKPAVVNLSVGSAAGPHDGTSSTSRYLAGIGKDAIIVVAAGNDGDYACALNYTFNRLSPSVTAGLAVTDPSETATADFWYNTSDSFKFEFLLHNISTGQTAVYELTEDGRTFTLNSSDDTFAEAYSSSSSVRLYGNVDPINNRYYVRAQLNLTRGASSNTSIVPGVRITGATGKKLNSTISNGEFVTNGIPSATAGTANGSISDMATGENIIVAGAYTSAKSFTTMGGSQLSYQGATDNGELCTFSSYGITYQGNRLPDLCAPGSAIVAAVNSYNFVSPKTSDYTARATFNGKWNYWAAMQGTSMACPFISGTVALMLEADPTLDVDKVRTILTETAIAPPSSATSDQKLQWGAGRVDVLAAVKKVLDDKASVGAVFADDERNLIITPVDGGYNVYVAGENAISVSVHDMTGRVVAAASADSNSVDIATAQLPKGIYIISATGSNSRHSRKIAL